MTREALFRAATLSAGVALAVAVQSAACRSGGAEQAAGEVPGAARDVISGRMQSHGTEMNLLLWAVLFLDHEGAEAISRAMISEPRLARPTGGADPTINAMIPPDFYTLQDLVSEKAGVIASLASAPNPDSVAIAKAYGELAETCVQCHSNYLFEREQPQASARLLGTDFRK